MDTQRTAQSATAMPGSKKSGGFTKKIFLAIIVIIVLGVAYITYSYSQNGYLPWAAQEQVDAAELASTVTAVSRLMELPQETPVYATVSDAAQLKAQQAFFQNAENGDRLLLYPSTRQAVLYSPTKKRIINVGPIDFGQQNPAAPAPTPAPEAPTKK